MKRNEACLVQKRDGRREWLRATKLARSIQSALDGETAVCGVGSGVADALEIASAVLADLSRRSGSALHRGAQAEPIVTTIEIASCVERMLFASGHARAATRYAAVRDDRARRTRVVLTAPRCQVAREGRALGVRSFELGRDHERN